MSSKPAVRITNTKPRQNSYFASHRQQSSGRGCSCLPTKEGNLNPLFASALVDQQGNYLPPAKSLHYVLQPAFLVDDGIAKTGAQMIQQPIRPSLLHPGGHHGERLFKIIHIMLGNFPVPYVGSNDQYTPVRLQSIYEILFTFYSIST